MLSYTNDFNTAIRATDRNIRGYLQFNGDSTKVIRDIDGLASFTSHHDAMNSERFCIGSVCSAYCEATFYNNYIPAGVSLANSYFDAYIGVTLSDNSVEYKCIGRFYISEVSRGTATTKVVGYDVTNRLSVEYTPTVTAGNNGYEVIDILNDIIDQTQVNGGTHFTTTGTGVYVKELVAGTCREQWGWLMSLCYNHGEISTGSRTVADLGYIEQRAYEDGKNYYTLYPAIDDTVTYMDGFNSGDVFTVHSLTTGTEEKPLVFGSGVGISDYNPYINALHGYQIFTNLENVSFMPMTLRFRGDPCIEVMDSIKVSHGGTDYRLVCMRITTTFNGGLEQTLECWGDSEAYYAMSQGTLERKVRQNSTILSEMAEAIENADNGVITKILDTDGSWKELVIANSQDLSQATSVWRFNINGLAHANAYSGGTYTLAMDTQGRIVASVIQTGILQDAAGKNSWDLDTGAFTITEGSINISTNSSSFDVISLRHDYGSNVDATSLSPSMLSSVSQPSGTHLRVGASGLYIANDSVNPNIDLFDLQQNVLKMRDSNAYVRFYATGLGLLKLGNYNGTETIQLNAGAAIGDSCSIALFDTSANERAILTNDGLTFKDANGTQTGFLGNDMNDYVIAKGTSSSWYYRRWKSGVYECWITRTFNLSNSTWSAWGSVYQTGGISRLSLPVTLASGHQEYVRGHSSQDWSCWIVNLDPPTTTQTGTYRLCRGTRPGETAPFAIDYYVRGVVA